MVIRGPKSDDSCLIDLPNYVADDVVRAVIHALACMNEIDAMGLVEAQSEPRHRRAVSVLTNLTNDIANGFISQDPFMSLMTEYGIKLGSENGATECQDAQSTT